jgi:amino acid adenylation domain-containing protein
MTATTGEVDELRANGAPESAAPPATRPLSLAEEATLAAIEQSSEPDSAATVSLAVRLRGDLDVDALAAAFEDLVARNDVLRTRFVGENGALRAAVADSADVALRAVDLTRLEPASRDAGLARIVSDPRRRRFDVSAEPPVRASLARLGESEWALLVTVHRAACDEGALGILAGELGELYRARVAGAAAAAPVPPRGAAPDAPHALGRETLAERLAYWRALLDGAPPLLSLPLDWPRPASPTWKSAVASFAVAPEVAAALDAVARERELAPRAVYLAAFQALLARHAGQHDVVAAVRLEAAEEGGATRLVPVRAEVEGTLPFVDLAERANAQLDDAVREGPLPFDVLVEGLGVERSRSFHPVAQVAFAFGAPAAARLALDGVEVEELDADRPASLDLELELWPDGDGLRGRLRYGTDLFEPATAERIAARLLALLASAAADPGTTVSRLALVPEDELRLVAPEWAPSPYPDAACVHELFEAVAARTPDAVAVTDSVVELTYAELDDRANRLAALLRDRGVGRERVVGVCAGRSVHTIAAFLGVLKAGGAYLPLDPSFPAERLRQIAEDAGIGVVLATEPAAGALPSLSVETLFLDAADALAREPGGAAPRVHPDGLAYVIYTSGSTGRPKGVEVTHRGACNLAAALATLFGLTPSDRVAFFSSLSFDASIWEILMALTSGARLCMLETGGRTVSELAEDVRALGVTAATFPPSFLRAADVSALAGVRLLVSAGEPCSAELARTWGRGRRFVNAYGPTEATVCATSADCNASDAQAPPIGRPLPNVRTYVVGPELDPAPLGVEGELLIGGVGLARCYRGRPRTTAESFVPDPFGPPGSRLYRTGDVARSRADGNLDYLGRVDHQVKVRGFRIELGEIESTLTRHPDVAEAAVLVRESEAGDPMLVAYVVLEPDARVIAARAATETSRTESVSRELQSFVERTLPAHMRPGTYVVLDALPLTPSGKLDREALPDPALLRADLDDEAFVGPATPTEQIVAGMWAEVLGLARVGRDDNFLEVGGHSLVAAEVIADVRERFSIPLPVRVLFEHPGLAEFAAAIDEACAREPAVAS